MDLDNSNFVNTTFLSYGILICSSLPEDFELNDNSYPVNLNYKLIDINKNAIIGDGYSNLYDLIYKSEISTESLRNKMTDIDYSFVGEKFYEGEK